MHAFSSQIALRLSVCFTIMETVMEKKITVSRKKAKTLTVSRKKAKILTVNRKSP